MEKWSTERKPIEDFLLKAGLNRTDTAKKAIKYFGTENKHNVYRCLRRLRTQVVDNR